MQRESLFPSMIGPADTVIGSAPTSGQSIIEFNVGMDVGLLVGELVMSGMLSVGGAVNMREGAPVLAAEICTSSMTISHAGFTWWM
jgi:hypothetical protein